MTDANSTNMIAAPTDDELAQISSDAFFDKVAPTQRSTVQRRTDANRALYEAGVRAGLERSVDIAADIAATISVNAVAGHRAARRILDALLGERRAAGTGR